MAMSELICPRCQESYTKPVVSQEWVQCGKCRHRWMVVRTEPVAARPPVSSVPLQPIVPAPLVAAANPMSPPAAVPVATRSSAVAPVTPAPPAAVRVVPVPVAATPAPPGVRVESDEYIPLETREMNDFTRPLTSRQHGGASQAVNPAIAAAIPAAIPVPAQPVPPLPAMPVMPAMPVVPPRTPPVRARASADGAAQPALPSEDPFDPGLFDRAERDARMARARQPTMAEMSSAVPLPVRPVVCTSCGHAFSCARADGEQETCPVCRVPFLVVPSMSPSSSTQDPLLGRALRGCLIDRKIGEGGMGAVYHARQVSLDRSVAIKVLPQDLARNRNFISRFEREAKNLARINHPNILHIYDFGEDTALGVYFMVIEFVEGRDLGEILHQERSLPALKVLDVIRQAALGLEMAWEKGVIHRDIKPDNLMMTEEGIWKVMDFGLAKASDDDRDVTTVGVRVGTPAFMSPEQCDGIEVDFRSDIYSLGCTAYLALTGRLPFDGETPFAIMLKHKSEAIPSIRDHKPDIPEVVDQLVRRMLAKDPKDRFASLRELIDLVEDLEVRAAGTTSVLRKTRGPFRALKQPEPMSDIIGGGRAQQTSGRTSSPTALSSVPPAVNPARIPDYLKPVEPPRPRTSGDLLKPPTQSPTSVRVSDSERLRSNLARVRRSTQRDEAAKAVAEAKRCEESGLFAAAADSWQRASQLVEDLAESAPLLERARAARRRIRMRRAARYLVVTSVVLALSTLAVWQGTPPLHNAYADQSLSAILELAANDRKAGLRRLEGFLATDAGPYAWYESLFQTTYVLEAAQRGREALGRMRLEGGGSGVEIPSGPVAPGGGASTQPVTSQVLRPDPLEQARQDVTVPWFVVVQRAEAALVQASADQRARIQTIRDEARLQVAAQEADLAAVGEAWSSGRHAEALAMAEAFAAQHQRAGERVPRLQAGRIEVRDADTLRVITDAQVTIQPMAQTVAFSALASPVAADGVFGRPTGISVVCTVTAPGFRSERLTIAADQQDLTPVKVALHPGIAWVRQLAPSMPQVGLGLLDAKTLVVASPEALACLRLDDGEITARMERKELAVPFQAEAGPPQWATWMQMAGDRLVVGTADGAVIRLKASTLSQPQQILIGRLPIVAWLEKDLTLKSGQRVMTLIETNGSEPVLRAMSGTKTLWRHPFSPGRQEPVLWASDDRLVAMHDHGLVVRDELDGRELARAEFSGARTSPPAILEQGQVAVVATTNGLGLMRIATNQEPLVVRECFSGESSACRMAAAGNHLLVARADRSLHLFAWNGKNLTRAWPHAITLPGDSGDTEILAVTPDYAVVIDNGGVMYLYGRSDGRLERRIAHGATLVAPPVQCGGRLLVADKEGRLTMYHLPRVR